MVAFENNMYIFNTDIYAAANLGVVAIAETCQHQQANEKNEYTHVELVQVPQPRQNPVYSNNTPQYVVPPQQYRAVSAIVPAGLRTGDVFRVAVPDGTLVEVSKCNYLLICSN